MATSPRSAAFSSSRAAERSGSLRDGTGTAGARAKTTAAATGRASNRASREARRRTICRMARLEVRSAASATRASTSGGRSGRPAHSRAVATRSSRPKARSARRAASDVGTFLASPTAAPARAPATRSARAAGHRGESQRLLEDQQADGGQRSVEGSAQPIVLSPAPAHLGRDLPDESIEGLDAHRTSPQRRERLFASDRRRLGALDDLGDEVVDVDALRLALEVQDDAMAERGRRDAFRSSTLTL